MEIFVKLLSGKILTLVRRPVRGFVMLVRGMRPR